MQLKAFRWKDRSALSLFGGQEGFKRGAILPLLRDFPRRRFVLIGDSGEQDPEIYGALARDFPDQVWGVYIRDVTGAGPQTPRYAAAFAGVRRERWAVFRRADELPQVLR
jgi:phosphatidate phosphatase APP1